MFYGRIGLIVATLTAMACGSALAQGTLRIGMTASDIPLTTGQTDQGGEGMRFMGYTVYDGLINWDLSSTEKPSDLVMSAASPSRTPMPSAESTARRSAGSCAASAMPARRHPAG